MRRRMSNDLISREALKKSLNFVYDCSYIESKSKEGIASDIIEEIDNAPTVETPTIYEFKGCDNCELERPKGEWIDYSNEGYVECPFCHEATNCEDNKDELHYCWNCGANMRPEEENKDDG